jgi:WD40 repeat protein
MMMKSFAYAEQQDLLLGSGIEFDAYAWDPGSGALIMTLIGHQRCLLQISILYDPYERALTLDDKGNLKVWNISRDVGRSALVLQTFEVALVQPYRISDLAVTFDDGKYVAVLADRVYFFNNVSVTAMEGCPVSGGLIPCLLANDFLVIFPRSVCVVNLITGAIRRTLRFTDSDRDCISPADTVTVAASDAFGKKIFLGTQSGFICMFDAESFGFLKFLHTPDSVGEISVVGLKYLQNQELIFAVFSNATCKVLPACHRTRLEGDTPSGLSIWNGGRTRMVLTVEGYLTDNGRRSEGGQEAPIVITICASERLGLVATSSSDGHVRVFELASFKLVGVYLTPVDANDSLIIPCNSLGFLDGTRPLLVGVDSNSRVTLWTVFPSLPECLCSFRLLITAENDCNLSFVTSAAWGVPITVYLYVGDDTGGLWIIDVSEIIANQDEMLDIVTRRLNFGAVLTSSSSTMTDVN